MGDHPVERDATANAPEDGRHAESGQRGAPNAPKASTREHEGGFDAAWTERMLNSLVAAGRRERGLVRDAESSARSYVAFATVARPLEGTSKGEMDRGTVEVPEREISASERERLRAERAAPTVLVRRERFPWKWVLVGIGAMASLGALWRNRPAQVSARVPEAARIAVLPMPGVPIAEPTATAAPIDRVTPPSAVSVTDRLERNRFPAKPADVRAPGAGAPMQPKPVPSGSENRGESHRTFVDVVNRY